jgi:DNA polymerase V
MDHIYACIDLKSFYASVECVERKLNPLTTNLVVADLSRTEKTICLAVTPSLKQYGLSGRSRLYEVIQKVGEVNKQRRIKAKGDFTGKSYDDDELSSNPKLELDYIVAPPRMKYYMNYSNKIYNVYLKYLDPLDIYVYSIDEVFMDITNYLNMYNLKPRELVTKMIQDVYETTGITATGGIGTNMYLAKIAMDIVAKHMDPNEYGVRMAYLDEYKYRELLWDHRPLTDFWRIGRGYATRLEKHGMYTIGDVARKSIDCEGELFKIFGVNAEILIDHAWGYEPCTIKDVKSYIPTTTSLSSGQVLSEPYDFNKARIIVREMAELLTLDMVKKNFITDNITLTIGYDISNLTNKSIKNQYDGEIIKDHYGRNIPKYSHGSIRLDHKTSSTDIITERIIKLYNKIANPILLIRRINIAVCDLSDINTYKENKVYHQFNLFSDQDKLDLDIKKEKEREMNEIRIQKVLIELKDKYGKNSILKGMNLLEGATTIKRNSEIGGHRSG